jgi:hypothetical protein
MRPQIIASFSSWTLLLAAIAVSGNAQSHNGQIRREQEPSVQLQLMNQKDAFEIWGKKDSLPLESPINPENFMKKRPEAKGQFLSDNMLILIPDNKDPDNMPIARYYYDKTGIADNMPNLFKKENSGIGIKDILSPAIKAKNKLRK